MTRRKKDTTEHLSQGVAAEETGAQPGDNFGFTKDQLRSFVERIERLEEEKKAIADDIKDVFGEAKANGFDVKALRAILRMRKEDAEARREHEAIVDLYCHALGIIPFDETPIGGGGR